MNQSVSIRVIEKISIKDKVSKKLCKKCCYLDYTVLIAIVIIPQLILRVKKTLD